MMIAANHSKEKKPLVRLAQKATLGLSGLAFALFLLYTTYHGSPSATTSLKILMLFLGYILHIFLDKLHKSPII